MFQLKQDAEEGVFVISNFRRVLNVVSFLLDDSPASEFYMLTFWNTLFHIYRQVGACRMNWLGTCLGYYIGKGLVSRCVVKFSPVVMYPFPK